MSERRLKHSEIQAILGEAANCKNIPSLCQKHGITEAKLRELQKKLSKDSPNERSRVITPGGYRPKTKSDFYNENLHHFQHASIGYD